MAKNDSAKAIDRVLRSIDAELEVPEEIKDSKSIDFLANYFSRVKNNEELFRLGKEISDNLKKGIKNVALTSPGLKNTQQKTILGLCCFFDRVEHLKIAIVTDDLNLGVFQDLVANSKVMAYRLDITNFEVKYSTYYHHFDFFDYAELLKFYDTHFYNETFDSELERIFDHYDLILWDTPELSKMKLNPHFHYRISNFYQSLSLIVSPHSSIAQIERIRDHFANYKLSLSRVLFDTSFDEDKTKRKKFLGIF
jgi:hypothetical protein